jgi:putative glutamine amidotransferase
MFTKPSPLRLGIHGPEVVPGQQARGCGLWAPGYQSAVVAAGGTPVRLQLEKGNSWDEVLEDVDGVILTGSLTGSDEQADEEELCQWCRKLGLPLLAVDGGLHLLNATYGGTLHLDLPRELPEALQHRHPPEEGLRHAINVEEGTRLAHFYGEGEIVVNSEHRYAVYRVARSFRVCARALDGVIEAIETEGDDWFAIGVQWHPASATASGLDIQLFRGLVAACEERLRQTAGERVTVAA